MVLVNNPEKAKGNKSKSGAGKSVFYLKGLLDGEMADHTMVGNVRGTVFEDLRRSVYVTHLYPTLTVLHPRYEVSLEMVPNENPVGGDQLIRAQYLGHVTGNH